MKKQWLIILFLSFTFTPKAFSSWDQRVYTRVNVAGAHLVQIKRVKYRGRWRDAMVRVPSSSLPIGTLVSLHPRKINFGAISKILEKRGRGYRRTNKHFYGGLLIESVPGSRVSRQRIGELNKQRIFIHEKYVHNQTVIRAIFNSPRGSRAQISMSLPWDKMNPQRSWTAYVEQSLRGPASAILSGKTPWDINAFCPKYRAMGRESRIRFWIKLVSEMTRHESRFNPLTAGDEALLGNYNVVSTGLMQMSLESVQRQSFSRYGCRIRTQQDLFEPKKNLQCAMAMLTHYVKSDGCISCGKRGRWRGSARYWAVMRTPYRVRCKICRGGYTTTGSRNKIARATRRLRGCR